MRDLLFAQRYNNIKTLGYDFQIEFVNKITSTNDIPSEPPILLEGMYLLSFSLNNVIVGVSCEKDRLIEWCTERNQKITISPEDLMWSSLPQSLIIFIISWEHIEEIMKSSTKEIELPKPTKDIWINL